MAKTRDTETGVYVTNYAPSRILVSLAFDGFDRTVQIRDSLGCSHKTALNRLHELTDVGVVENEQIGNAYRWSLKTDGTTGEIVADWGQNEVAELIGSTLVEAADRLEGEQCDISEQVVNWVAERGVPDEVSTSTYGYRMAVYRRFLRAILYKLHYQERESLNPLQVYTDWEEAFTDAAAKTNDAGFEESIIDSLVQSPPDELDMLLVALQAPLVSRSAPAEVLSAVYEQLAPQDARRDLGQFATPSFVSEFMVEWSLTDADDTVLDPGIGAGQLSTHAIARKIELGVDNPVSEITGIDIDEVAISMAAVSLKLADGQGYAKLVHDDFIQQTPHKFAEEGHEIKAYDAVVANPPYSRVQALSPRLRDDLERVISKETGYDFSQRTPLYGYFLVHASQFLETGGRMAAIVPSKFMDTKFGRDLKRYLLSEFTIHGVVQLSDSIDVFDGVRARPSILLLEKGVPNANHEVWFGKIEMWESTIDPATLLQSEPSDSEAIGTVTTIAQELLVPTERWSHYLDDTEILKFPELIRFDEIADISRGIATGHNDYFCLTKEDVGEYNIPQEYRRPIIRSAHGLNRVHLDKATWEHWRDKGKAVWLLYCYDEDGNVLSPDEIDSEGVHEYLDKADELDTKDRYLVSGRDPWYRVESQEPAPILGKYMNRTGFLFMRNDAGLLSLNNIHIIDLEFNWRSEHRDALLAYLNSRMVSRVLSRESHDYNGLQKLEISHLSKLPVIHPCRLTRSKLTELASLFEKLCEARNPISDRDDADKLLCQIDEALKPLLNIDDE